MTILFYIFVALLAFGVMIFIHELGHFLLARACGVKVYEFSMGMGPRLCGFHGKDGTAYQLRAFPIGGFVSMKGEDEEADGEDSFSHKAPWQKFLIVAAGGTMNILLAVLLTLVLVLSSQGLLGTTVIHSFDGDALSSAKLQTEDRIVAVDGTAVHTWQEAVYEIAHEGYRPISVTVVRDGKTVVLSDVEFPTVVSQGILFGSVDFVPYGERKTPLAVLKHTFYRSVSTVKMIWDSIFDLIGGRFGVEEVSGPVGVTGALGEAAKSGALDFLYLVSVLSMNLGVFNLLPLPALDGGRLLVIMFEMIFRRRVPARFEGAVHFVGILILFGLMILITFKDIVKLIGG
ncbi:MAG: site-2 protease family protein [Clostridia bacterium]|nr:site-2 protease family protein [Clostridia bacterium]